ARPKAGQSVTAEELTAGHVKPLPGKAISATTMVDPLTLEPVAGTSGNPAATPALPAPAAPAVPAPASPTPAVPKDP
ncbi:MAG: cytochrome c family protein, partial [Verrucomicrobiota bacterium]